MSYLSPGTEAFIARHILDLQIFGHLSRFIFDMAPPDFQAFIEKNIATNSARATRDSQNVARPSREVLLGRLVGSTQCPHTQDLARNTSCRALSACLDTNHSSRWLTCSLPVLRFSHYKRSCRPLDFRSCARAKYVAKRSRVKTFVAPAAPATDC